jgi:hypothetical protein
MEFKQVKVRADPEIAALFKAACASSGVSMASELTKLMAERAKTMKSANDKAIKRIAARGGRRSETRSIIERLEEVRDAEEAYMLAIPENLQGGPAYDAAEGSVDLLGQAIELLREAY